MKSYTLKPTTENLLQSIRKNTIGRNKDVWSFCRLLNSIDDSFSIAVDGAWGSGKTFFVKQAKLIMDANNPNIANDELTKAQETILTSLINKEDHFFFQPQVCVYYDAWENDNDEDPILSLVYTILQSVDSDHAFPKDSTIIAKAAAILECFTGKNYASVLDSFKKNTIFDKLRSQKDLESNIKAFLDELLEERGQRLIVFIDELDRCKPPYAVQVLERIKHYFDNARITFVFSINAKELEHTIKQYYGSNFDSGRYLDRFFDLRMSLPTPNMGKIYQSNQSINFNDSPYWYDMCCRAVIEANNFSLRETAKYFQATKIAGAKYFRIRNQHLSSDEGKAIMTILPVMIGLKVINANQYTDFILGKNAQPLINMAKIVSECCFDFLLLSNEVFYELREERDSRTVVTIEDKVSNYYYVLFSNNPDIHLGHSLKYKGIEVADHVPDILCRAANFLSEYTDFED